MFERRKCYFPLPLSHADRLPAGVGQQEPGPWATPGSGDVPAAFGPWISLVASPVCCPCRLRSWGNTSSWDWKWRVIGSHDTRVKQTACNNSKTVETKSTPRALSTPHLMREALHRCQQADGGEREHVTGWPCTKTTWCGKNGNSRWGFISS